MNSFFRSTGLQTEPEPGEKSLESKLRCHCDWLRPIGSGVLCLTGKQRTPCSGAGTREVSALSHRRIADSIHVFPTRKNGSGRTDESLALRKEAQRSVRQPGWTRIPSVLLLPSAKARGGVHMAGPSQRVRSASDGQLPRKGCGSS